MSDGVPGRAFLSIGEVLELLREEAPDITISKIRFLESQGLIEPERNPSGYRKFHESDVERLRWILRQQRESFLPLKVIKENLSRGKGDLGAEDAAPESPGRRSRPASEEQNGEGPLRPATHSDTSFTRQEVADASGLSPFELGELERYGLLVGRTAGDQRYYHADAMLVARLAASFARHGVEARHLRMYRIGADREAGFLEQVVAPLAKQRNPDGRRQAVETLGELARLGEDLRGALLRTALRSHLDLG